MVWYQRQIRLPALSRGCHLITHHVEQQMPEIGQVRVGLLHVFLMHTSASLTLNENADPDVRRDMEMALDRVVPESWPYVHTCEGPDDMPAHVKTSLIGSSLTIPIRDGRLALGMWQGIYLCEHRCHGGPRRVILTAIGTTRAEDD